MLVNVRHIGWSLRDKHRETAIVTAGSHRIEVHESPTGRSVMVYVDGVKVWPR